jgi:hypothetical protein
VSFDKSPHTPSNANMAASRRYMGANKSTDSESNSIYSGISSNIPGKQDKKQVDTELRDQRNVKRIQLSDLNLD